MDHRVRVRVAAVLAVVGLLGACGGGGDGEAATTAADQAEQVADAAEGATAVKVVNTSFSPASVTVAVGEVVRWSFEDAVEHTVTADDGSFDSGRKSGGTFEHDFGEAGEVAYHCEIHPFMKGTVTVS